MVIDTLQLVLRPLLHKQDSMVTNDANIDKTFSQLDSDEGIKYLLPAMVTTNALDKLNISFFNESGTISVNGQRGAAVIVSALRKRANNFSQNLFKNMTNNIASSVIGVAMNCKYLINNSVS